MDKLFDNKRTYIGYDGEEYIDMSIPVVNTSKIKGYSTITLNQDHNGRIDRLTWNEITKNMDMIDIVMYANHIYNPFAVKEGDLIYVPNDNDDLYISSGEPTLIDGTKYSSTLSNEKNMTYAETIEYLAKKGLGVK